MGCDFCTDDFYSDNLKFYVNGHERIWDGWCKPGSRVYFMDLSAQNIVDNIILSNHVLEELPDSDDPIVIYQAEWIEAEVARAKRELLFRLEDDVHSTQKPQV